MNNADMPAMPVENTSDYYHGLTKREYFAGLAMQGLLGEDVNHGYNVRTVAKWAVEQADALLYELNNRGNGS